MALHIKSHKSFIILIAFSALSISAMAATFSVTGIATLFSGYFFTVALMMGVLEFGKIVVASFVARFWQEISKVLKAYFIAALTVLILITSGGIFGYLSDAYQRTKGDYTVIEKQISLIDAKIRLFQSEKDRVQNRMDVLTSTRVSQETRLDSLYSRGQHSTAKRVELQIESANKEVSQLSVKLNAVNDSIGFYETSKVEKETINVKGELGPLKYIAGIFNTDMDTVVKYFIFMLIFVFDPLAVLLFVSINLLIKTEEFDKKNNIDSLEEQKLPIIKNENEFLDDSKKKAFDVELQATQNIQEHVNNSDKVEVKENTDIIKNIIEPVIIQPDLQNDIEKKSENVTNDIVKEKVEHAQFEEVKKKEENKPAVPVKKITWKSANFHG